MTIQELGSIGEFVAAIATVLTHAHPAAETSARANASHQVAYRQTLERTSPEPIDDAE